jgi:hypothetical protein
MQVRAALREIGVRSGLNLGFTDFQNQTFKGRPARTPTRIMADNDVEAGSGSSERNRCEEGVESGLHKFPKSNIQR